MVKDKIQKLIKEITGKEAELEHPAKPEFGDYSTNVALKEKINPKELVEKLKDNPLFEKVEIAGPGFINFTLSKECLQRELAEIIKQGENYGDLKIGKNKKVQVEFISANPTGPLTVANARGGPFGDALANVLEKAGYQAEKAYYINDYGAQVLALGHSVLKDAKAKYRGKYINELNERLKEKTPAKVGRKAVKIIMEEMIKKTVERMGIKYDEWVWESEFHKAGKVDQILNSWKEKGLIYHRDKAWWFCSSKYSDDKDRPVIKSDGARTYLAGDIAHHDYKFNQKKFDKVINIWGADHHGDVKRLKAAAEVLGHKGKLEIILLQFVTLLEKGARQKMSKRAGKFVTMDELLDKVGVDAAKFFFLQKSPDTHLNFDIALAKEQSKKNPVYYVQYAYARICSVIARSERSERRSNLKKIREIALSPPARIALRSMAGGAAPCNDKHSFLTHPAELNLIRELVRFPEIIEQTAKDYQVQRLTYYSLKLAEQFHQFYEQCRVIDEKNKELTEERIRLIKATKIVLKNVLDLMGIGAPKKM